MSRRETTWLTGWIPLILALSLKRREEISFDKKGEKKEAPMEGIIEIVRHTEHLIPALRVELLCYVGLTLLTFLLGVVGTLLRRE